MRIIETLQGVKRLFVDTAPVIYFVEGNPVFSARVTPIFELVDAGLISLVTSPVTLSECLVYPYRLQDNELAAQFRELLVNGEHVTFVVADQYIADRAAQLRAHHNLTLPDALQAATALAAGCDALVTNDAILKRVTDLHVLVLDEFDLE